MSIERKLSSIPLTFVGILLLGLSIQIYSTWVDYSQNRVEYSPLKTPQSKLFYQLTSLDSQYLAGHLLTLELQLHDNQQGQHLSYKNMSFPILSEWLLRLQDINQNSEYPALLASRVFSNTKDKTQLKLILETVIKLFENNPQKNWRWIAEGAVIAKYHLRDLDLALVMAKKISNIPKEIYVPTWARDLELIILEDLNMFTAAIYIVEQSLKDTSDIHPDEKRFLEKRLLRLKQKTVGNTTENKKSKIKTR